MAEATASQPVALFKKRTKANTRKRPPPAATLGGQSSDSENSSSNDDNSTHLIKRRRKNGVPVASSAPTLTDPHPNSSSDLKPTEFRASNSTKIIDTNDATRTRDWYDDNTSDALDSKVLLGKSSYGQPAPSSIHQDRSSDGVYRGAAAYTSHIQKTHSTVEKKSSIGPVKAPPTNIRTITVTDFAPDVCKDYKQTGFCGFGDSCKFLHAREDYKQGWELDKEWEKVDTGKKPVGGKVISRADRSTKVGVDSDEDDETLLEGIPFACIICRHPYNQPIITKCGHYFCEKCALDRYRKTPNCAACGAGTNGVFNAAKGLKAILDRKRKLAAKMGGEGIEAGGQDGSEDQD